MIMAGPSLQSKNERVYPHFKCQVRSMGQDAILEISDRRNEDSQMAASDLCTQTQ